MKISRKITSLLALLLVLSTLMMACGNKEEAFKDESIRLSAESSEIDGECLDFLIEISGYTTSYNKKDVADRFHDLVKKYEKLTKKYKNLEPPKDVEDEFEEFCKLLDERQEEYLDFESSIREDNSYTMKTALENITEIEEKLIDLRMIIFNFD